MRCDSSEGAPFSPVPTWGVSTGVRGLSRDFEVPFENRAAYEGSAGLRLNPPQAGPEAFPQGSVAPQARAGSDPDRETTGVTSAGFPGRRTDVRRGVAHSPALRPKSGERIRQRAAETQRGQRVSRTGAPERYAHKYATKGGPTLVAPERGPEGDPGAGKLPPGVGPVRRVPRVVVPMAAQRAAVEWCDTFRSLLPRVRLAVPDHAARCGRECSMFPPLPSLIRDCRTVEEVAPDVTSIFGGRV